MDRQSSTSGNYRNCSKIFDPHGDGSSIGPHGLTGHSLKWFQSAHLIWSQSRPLLSSLQQAHVTLPLQPLVIARISIA
jgi:hypothetical protein